MLALWLTQVSHCHLQPYLYWHPNFSKNYLLLAPSLEFSIHASQCTLNPRVGPNNSICLTGTSCNLQDVKLQGLWSFIPKQTFNRIWGPIKPKLVSNVRRLIYQWANCILILAYFAAVILDFIIRFNETPRATLGYKKKIDRHLQSIQ